MVRKALGLIVDAPHRVRATVDQTVDSTTELAGSVRRVEQRLSVIADLLGAAGQDIRELSLTGQRQDARVARIEDGLAEFNRRLTAIEGHVSQVARDVDEATDRLPEEHKGPLGKARDVLMGSGSR